MNQCVLRATTVGAAFAGAVIVAAEPAPDLKTIDPQIVETRTVNVTQAVSLADIPAGSKNVRLWVPVPTDSAWQRVLDCQVVSAPGTWKVVPQAEGRGAFIYVELKNPTAATAEVVVQCVVERKGVYFPLETAVTPGKLQPVLFEEALNWKSPLMEVDPRVQALADKACGNERDPAKQAILIMKAVADVADHYSKDSSKPKCGRGAASDCLDQGGGCCTDLHALFIAMARSRGVPARMQYGYRLLDAKAGQTFDPGYRCWVEYFIPGAGWVPTDVVAADNADAANPKRWASLSATRVWLWEGRSFELTPKASGPVHTMLCGWAEIDGKPVDVLPAADGSPSKLTRAVRFEVLKTDRDPSAPKLPE
ncbi:MAG: transglutaminase-like domain-containing protein [Phycisphaerales bacterium]|nr:transglutaminase-like domain-containing protein [Phycisphaerales bacterium]